MKMKYIFTVLSVLLLSQFAFGQSERSSVIDGDSVSKGVASYYHDKFVGRHTSTGEVFSNDKYTAASNHLSLNTYVKVTNIKNGKYLYVRINDRMSKNNKRLIDMASICAKKLDYKDAGLANVKVEVVPEEEGKQGILAQKNGIQLEDESANKL